MIPTNDRGQTETLGFILIFSIIIISIGAIYTSGITDLTDQRESVAFDNTERSMFIHAANVEDIYKHGAPSRATEFKLYDNALSVRGATRFDVTVTNTSSGTTQSYGTYVSKRLAYESDEGSLVYELGAVVRNRAGSRAAVQSEPPFAFTDEGIVLVHINLKGSETVGSNSDTVLAVSEERATRLKANEPPTATGKYNVTINIKTSPERARAWQEYFESEGLDDTGATDLSNGVVEYKYANTDQVILRQTIIEISIQQ